MKHPSSYLKWYTRVPELEYDFRSSGLSFFKYNLNLGNVDLSANYARGNPETVRLLAFQAKAPQVRMPELSRFWLRFSKARMRRWSSFPRTSRCCDRLKSTSARCDGLRERRRRDTASIRTRFAEPSQPERDWSFSQILMRQADQWRIDASWAK